MEIKVHLPPWPKLRLILFLLLPLLAVFAFWLYLIVSTSIYSLIYPKEQPRPEIVELAKTMTIPEPPTPPDNLALARQALTENKLAEAYDYFKLVVTANADELAARTQLRSLALKLGKIDDLKKFYMERMVAQPKEDAYPLSLGTIYMTVDRNKEKAREMFELSLKLNPLSAAAKYNLSVLVSY